MIIVSLAHKLRVVAVWKVAAISPLHPSSGPFPILYHFLKVLFSDFFLALVEMFIIFGYLYSWTKITQISRKY